MNRREAIVMLATGCSGTLLMACSDAIPVIRFDRDSCEYCRMAISDRRFGAAARTTQGRVVRFDSIECLVAWTRQQDAPPKAIWLVDAMEPGTLRPLSELTIHQTPPGTSPMGMGYVALDTVHGTTPWDGGAVVPWREVQPANNQGGR